MGRYTTKDIPTLRKGKGWKGPEPYGCFNTGVAVVILHSRTFEDYPDLAGGYRYAVGPSSSIHGAIMHNCLKHRTGHVSSVGEGVDRVKLYKTGTAARRAWVKLANKQAAWNDAQRAEHNRLRAAANKGDMDAMMALADF